ncbi:hypothetical protein ZWY2020_052368 [Hordeum vulgare]|nr:hypothetical protein ZWY2020_052368 [Hordeum vulgare]
MSPPHLIVSLPLPPTTSHKLPNLPPPSPHAASSHRATTYGNTNSYHLPTCTARPYRRPSRPCPPSTHPAPSRAAPTSDTPFRRGHSPSQVDANAATSSDAPSSYRMHGTRPNGTSPPTTTTSPHLPTFFAPDIKTGSTAVVGID